MENYTQVNNDGNCHCIEVNELFSSLSFWELPHEMAPTADSACSKIREAKYPHHPTMHTK
jgi:hypothetical protein